MAKLEYTKAIKIDLKKSPDFNEKWVQDIIADDPTILGIGELDLISKERVHEKAGRLDLLFADSDDSCRYEVELMLGRTDESHIIRCIEYWDIERRRYPGYEHVAVIIAEDITSRFLNVLGLFSGTIPLIAIQLNALEIEGRIVLDFVKVLEQTLLRMDDTVIEASTTVDRAYWENTKSILEIVRYADEILKYLNSKSKTEFTLNYVKSYISLREGNISRGFVRFRPQKSKFRMKVQITDKSPWVDRLDEAGVNFSHSGRFINLILKPEDIKEYMPLIEELIEQSVQDFEG